MHAVVMERLEEYLAGTLNPADERQVEAHLNGCPACREELAAMEDVSLMFHSLRVEGWTEPAPGFYSQVMAQVGEAQTARSVTSGLFGIDLVFARRLAFACLLTLAILGSYLVSRESSYSNGPSPEAVMAQQGLPAFDSAPAHDNMLIALTAYEH